MSAFQKTVYIDNQVLRDMFDLSDNQQIMEMELKFDQNNGEWMLIGDILDCSDESIEDMPF
jgi:hypothetical protein